jgi:hypothetical protein
VLLQFEEKKNEGLQGIQLSNLKSGASRKAFDKFSPESFYVQYFGCSHKPESFIENLGKA